MMIHLTSKTDHAGKLAGNGAEVDTGVPNAEVRLTLEIGASDAARRRREEYRAWLKQIAGSNDDPTFERPPQPELPPAESSAL